MADGCQAMFCTLVSLIVAAPPVFSLSHCQKRFKSLGRSLSGLPAVVFYPALLPCTPAFRPSLDLTSPHLALKQGAAGVLFRGAKDKEASTKEYVEKFANPYSAARYGFVDAVILPRDTRAVVCMELDRLRNKVSALEAPRAQDLLPPHTRDLLPPHTRDLLSPHTRDLLPPHTRDLLPPHTRDLLPHPCLNHHSFGGVHGAGQAEDQGERS